MIQNLLFAGLLFAAPADPAALAGPAWQPAPGTPVLLQFWASWCGGCAGVAEQLVTLELDGRLQRAAISIDQHRVDAVKAAPRIAAAGGPQLSVLYDSDGRWAQRYAVQTAPTLVLLDSKGDVHWRFQGHPSSADLSALVDAVAELK